ncbi:MAG: hypothetical protein ABDH16_01580 [Thermodesulfovibrionaceae bacterium]
MPEIIEKITKEELETLIKQILEDFIYGREQKVKELSLIERIIRVEEEIKALKEIERTRFEVSDKRFETIQNEIKTYSTKGFEVLEKRLSVMQWLMGASLAFISIIVVILGIYKILVNL